MHHTEQSRRLMLQCCPFSVFAASIAYIQPWIIDACSKKGRSPNSRQNLTTLDGSSCNPNQKPGPPRGMKGYAVSGRTDKVTLNWQAPNNPATACLTGYRLEGFDATTGVGKVYLSLLPAKTPHSSWPEQLLWLVHCALMSTVCNCQVLGGETAVEALHQPPPLRPAF